MDLSVNPKFWDSIPFAVNLECAVNGFQGDKYSSSFKVALSKVKQKMCARNLAVVQWNNSNNKLQSFV